MNGWMMIPRPAPGQRHSLKQVLNAKKKMVLSKEYNDIVCIVQSRL